MERPFQVKMIQMFINSSCLREIMKILSFGAGVQTTALLFTIGKDMDYVVFADTGNEHEETYDYISNVVVPYCRSNNINFVRVYNKYGKTLYQYCFDKKIVPSIKFRDCTTKFKIAPIRKFLREELGVNRKDPVEVYIGISWEESDRMNESNVKYAISKYPLVDKRITRDMCKDIILSMGYQLPPKSGCVFCPFATATDLVDSRYVDKTIELEENGSRFPEIKLRGIGKNLKTVRELKVLGDNITEKDRCKSGYCMV